MRALTLLLASSLSAFALTAGATALPTAIAIKNGPTGTYAGSPVCGLVQVADKAGISDGEIAYIYIQANLFEVERAQLGSTLGTASEVKKHGQDVAKDHGGVVKMFQELLLKSNVKPVTDAGSAERVAAQAKVVAGLKQKSGADFDRAYIAHEVANHRAVIKALRETIIPATINTQLIAHFNTVLPAFEHHLAMTIDAAKALGVDVGE